MKASPLAVLRMATPGSPTLRQLGAKLGVSGAAVSQFELGQRRLAPVKLRLYARIVRRTLDEVETRFLEARHDYHMQGLQDVREALKKRGAHKRRPGRASAGIA